MDKSKFKIYLFAQEANAQFARRISGLGVAYGIGVEVVSQLSELPLIPAPHCSLIIPSKLAGITAVTTRAWGNILVIDLEDQIPKKDRGSTRNNPLHENIATWTKIIGAAIALHSPKHHVHSWHCANYTSHGKIKEISALFQDWTKRYKVGSYRAIQHLTAAIERLTNLYGTETGSLDTSADVTSLTLTLTLNDTPTISGTALKELINVPMMTYACIRGLQSSTIFQFKVEFGPTKDISIRVLQRPLDEETNIAPEQEAS